MHAMGFFKNPTMRAAGAALLIVLIGIGVWLFLKGKTPIPGFGTVPPSAISGSAPYDGPALTGAYTNKQFRFSLSLPDGFSANELPPDENGGVAVVLQDKTGEGIQIYIVPGASDTKTLTADAVRAALPDMQVGDPEPVTIGPEYTGVAFTSDNPSFDGASREVWFYFRGNLYQISTYARLDPLLKAMFGTWKFF